MSPSNLKNSNENDSIPGHTNSPELENPNENDSLRG
jgi:hypothetical protein